jgi:MinD superfamily P-loop ATPase
MVAATKTADFALLVTEPTPFGLYDLSLAVETLRHLRIPLAVVVNRSGNHDHQLLKYCADEEISDLGQYPGTTGNRQPLLRWQDALRRNSRGFDRAQRDQSSFGAAVMKEIVIISGKGGTGKTSVAAALACVSPTTNSSSRLRC